MGSRSTKNNLKKLPKRQTAKPALKKRAFHPEWYHQIVLFFFGFPLFVQSLAHIRAILYSERMLERISSLGMSTPTACFILGFIIFLLAFIAVRFPAKPYIIAHELTHAIFGLLRGARISKLTIHEHSGSVTVSHSGLLVLLAPYFFPLYCVGALILFALLSLVPALEASWISYIFTTGIGFCWGFHFCFTLNAMLQRQSDLERYGFFFSTAFIFLLNTLMLNLIFLTITPIAFNESLDILYESTISTWLGLWDYCWNG